MSHHDTSPKETAGSTVTDVICYHSDLSAFIYSPTDIQTIEHVEGDKCRSRSPVKTPQNIFDSIHNEDKEMVESLIEDTLTNNTTNTTSCRLSSKDGEWRLFELSLRPASDYPDISSAILTGTDVSGQYYFEQRRRVINRVLRHDLRNEMNIVEGNAKIIKELGPENITKYADEIKDVAENMVSLGNEVREIDQELNRVNRRVRCMCIKEVLLKQIEQKHNRHPKITFKTEIDDIQIVGNTLVNSAIHHLITNSIEHSGKSNEELTIEITTTVNEEDNTISVNVIDNGRGIPQGEKEVIQSGIETPLDHISGLGLWMVKWVAESVNGEFIIDQRKGVEGTIATLKFASGQDITTEEAKNMLEEKHNDQQSKLTQIARSGETMKTSTRTE
jgi:signal transduction histidine kinase